MTAAVTYLLRTRVCILIWSLFVFLSSEVQELLRPLQKHHHRFSEHMLHSHRLTFVLYLGPEIQNVRSVVKAAAATIKADLASLP